MQLPAYLERIGYSASLAPTAETLRALHRAHLLAIPYENLDIHRGRPLTLDEHAIFQKIVVERRGGWCYEMNTLLAWALRELGFPVRLLSSAVNRAALGERAEGNHLVLLVELERPYLVDVGFGNGFLEPLPLEEGEFHQGFLSYRLARQDERWYFQNHMHGGSGFDFTLEPRQLEDFAGRCHELQTSPDSGFVRVTVCHRFTAEGIDSLRGAVLSQVTHAGLRERVIEYGEEYAQVLRDMFGLELDDAEQLWERVWRSHLAWKQAQSG